MHQARVENHDRDALPSSIQLRWCLPHILFIVKTKPSGRYRRAGSNLPLSESMCSSCFRRRFNIFRSSTFVYFLNHFHLIGIIGMHRKKRISAANFSIV